MRIGVVVAQDFWMHFAEIYATLQTSHTTSVFQERRSPFHVLSARTNRFLLRRDLTKFMRLQDVTFFEWSEELFVAATNLSKSCPIVTRLHLHELWDFAPQANLENVDQFIFVSRAMESKFLARFPAVRGRTLTIHNGVNLDKFVYARRPFRRVIGMLSRIEPHKRTYDMIITLYQLRRCGYDLTLDIGGSCTEDRYRRYDHEVHRLVEKLDLEPYVNFQGHVVDTPHWFQGIDIFISNSCSEGLQVALLEAMASGCYCLSHFWDGAEEALPPENLFITDADLQARIMAFYDATEDKRASLNLQMRQIAEERFDIDRHKIQVKEIIEHVAQNGR